MEDHYERSDKKEEKERLGRNKAAVCQYAQQRQTVWRYLRCMCNRPDNMVYYLSHCLKQIKKKLSLVCTVALVLYCISGCGIIQPSREDLARESFSFIDRPFQADIVIDLISDSPSGDEVVMYYRSSVLHEDDVSQWNGVATIYWHETFFKQNCVSISTPELQCKQRAGLWMYSDAGGITDSIAQWLRLVEAGYGNYDKKPVIPASLDDSLRVLEEETYQVSLTQQSVNWKSICDTHLDSLFGGEELITAFTDLQVDLFFSTETHTLVAVFITSPHLQWIEATIILKEATDIPAVDVDALKIIEGILHEDWRIIA